MPPLILLADRGNHLETNIRGPPGLSPRAPWALQASRELLYSKDHNNRTPPLTFRTYQILPHTNSHFHRLYSCLDLPPRGPWGTPGGAKPPWHPHFGKDIFRGLA